MNTDNKESSMTQVKTLYARVAILLLAINFGFTGYITYNMSKIQHGYLDDSTAPLISTPSPASSSSGQTTSDAGSRTQSTASGGSSGTPLTEPTSQRSEEEGVINK